LPKLQQKQQQLERQLQVARGTYEELLKRSQQVDVVANQNVGNARVVSMALLPNKASNKITLYLALGGFLGILLGVGIALILEAMDRSLKTIEQAQQFFDYPLLGTIPHLGQKSKGGDADFLVELPVRENSYSAANSAFEMLQTNLDFTVFDKPLKVIAVVSS
ncbi:MAG: GNVR domain-containing protein, partial [Nostoc sp.]